MRTEKNRKLLIQGAIDEVRVAIETGHDRHRVDVARIDNTQAKV